MINFAVADWSAWAPGLQDREDWLLWARNPFLPRGEQAPGLVEVPAMQRRRIERLGRMAIQAAYWCDQAGSSGTPLVFASRHGDVARSMELLEALADEQAMSPTGFGLSVHNAIAALYSIVRGERGNYLAIAAGKATTEAACIEAAGLLADGAPEVLIVGYEASLPEKYQCFADEEEAFYAWSWRVAATGTGPGLSLDWRAVEGHGQPAPGALPHGLDMLRFLLSGEETLEFGTDGLAWTWRRHA